MAATLQAYVLALVLASSVLSALTLAVAAGGIAEASLRWPIFGTLAIPPVIGALLAGWRHGSAGRTLPEGWARWRLGFSMALVWIGGWGVILFLAAILLEDGGKQLRALDLGQQTLLAAFACLMATAGLLIVFRTGRWFGERHYRRRLLGTFD